MDLNPSELKQILRELTEEGQLMRPHLAKQKIPDKPGLYSIFLDSIDTLPQQSPFKEELINRETNLLYVGQAKSQSLKKRLVKQDLSGQEGHSTFFRSIGSVLGFRPKLGSLVDKINKQNYVFIDEDKKEIVNWIDAHIQIRWREVEPCVIDKCEKYLIQYFCPLLNLKNNPRKFEPLKRLRSECLDIARIRI